MNDATADAETETPEADELIEIATDNMLGALMAISLDAVKAAPAQWHLMNEDQQERLIERLHNRTKQAVRESVYLISAQGFVRVPATLEQVVAKDGLKAVVIPAAHGSQKYALLDAVGQSITLVLANPDQFVDQPHGHKAEPVQRALPLDGAPVDAAAVDAAFGPEQPEPKRKKRRKADAAAGLDSAEAFREFPTNEAAADYLKFEATWPEPMRCLVADVVVDVWRDGSAKSVVPAAESTEGGEQALDVVAVRIAALYPHEVAPSSSTARIMFGDETTPAFVSALIDSAAVGSPDESGWHPVIDSQSMLLALDNPHGFMDAVRGSVATA